MRLAHALAIYITAASIVAHAIQITTAHHVFHVHLQLSHHAIAMVHVMMVLMVLVHVHAHYHIVVHNAIGQRLPLFHQTMHQLVVVHRLRFRVIILVALTVQFLVPALRLLCLLQLFSGALPIL